MHRSLLPFLLASLGFFMALVVVDMPMFEWQVSEIVTDLPSIYKVHIFPSPWTTYIGDAIDNGSYILREGINMSMDGELCSKENLKFTVRRSQNIGFMERMLNAYPKSTSPLFVWCMLELVLSGIYIWWFVIKYKHGSASQAFIFMGIAGFICIFLILTSRIVGPRLSYPEIADCYGEITFNVRLLKVHYETLVVLLVCILAELGALGIALRQIRRAIGERKKLA